MELRARAYRLLVRRQGEPDFEFFRHGRTAVRSFPERPIKDACVALVTAGGLYHRPTSEPFAPAPGRGDPTFRELPSDAPREALAITPGRFDLRAAEVDREVVYPIDSLRRAVEAGHVGSVCALSLSLLGHLPDPRRLLEETGPAAAERLRAQGANAVIAVAACPLGSQSVGVAALAFESGGLPTVVVAQWPELAREVGAARAVGSPFPFGMTMGPPKVGAVHDWLLRRAVGLFSPRHL